MVVHGLDLKLSLFPGEVASDFLIIPFENSVFMWVIYTNNNPQAVLDPANVLTGLLGS